MSNFARAGLECAVINAAFCGLWIWAFGNGTDVLSTMCLVVPSTCSVYATLRMNQLDRLDRKEGR